MLDAALLWARAPKLFLSVALLYGAIDRRRSPIDPALRSLLTVRISQLNGCRFCVDLNSATLLKRGVSETKIGSLQDWGESELFDEKERAALNYAETVTSAPDKVTDAQIDGLRKYFTDDGIVELTTLIAFQNMSSKFNSALGVLPQGFCQIPERASGSVGVSVKRKARVHEVPSGNGTVR